MSDVGNNRDSESDALPTGARMVPHITVQAFCENANTAQAIETAMADRRMNKVALTTHNGGISAATELYRSNPTPNLIILEVAPCDKSELLAALEGLSAVCDATTRVVVIGHQNDIELYRQLIRFGVSEYLAMPMTPSNLVDTIAEQYASDSAPPIGRTIAFYGASGGVGSSTLAHNTAWAISHSMRRDLVILDMDLAFGTAGLNFNQEPPHGLADAALSKDVVDDVVVDRLMSKCSNHVNLLAAPGTIDDDYDFGERSFERVIEICQNNIPIVVLDLPHAWNSWVRHTLATVDEIVLVAEPDLANLRNAKTIVDRLRQIRKDEPDPVLVLNKTEMPRRPEIAVNEFSASLEIDCFRDIPCDPAIFGSAANNGQMISEVNSSHKVNEVFESLARKVTGREQFESGTEAGMIPGLLKKLKLA